MATFTKDVEEIRDRAMRKIEEGAVTDSYKLDKDEVVNILNEALATEIVCVLRYTHHYFMATGVHGRGVADIFKEHADEEREHADEIAERISQLGGKPNFNPGDLVSRSVSQYIEGESLAGMIREDLIAERMVIDVYQRMIEYFGMKDPTTRALLEHIKAEEEEHASELSDMLFIVDPATGEEEGIDPGVDPLHREGRQQHASGEKKHSSGFQDRDRGRGNREIASSGGTSHWGNESNIGQRGKGSPARTSTAPEHGNQWGNESHVGRDRGNGRQQREADDNERNAPVEEATARMSKRNQGTKQNAGSTGPRQGTLNRSGNDKRNTNVTNRPEDEHVTPAAERGTNRDGRTAQRSNQGSGNLANSLGRSAADRDTRRERQQDMGRGEMRPTRDRGASKEYNEKSLGLQGENEPPASNIGGVGGRTMNRRRNETVDLNPDDIPNSPNRGASMGTNRSPKVMQKNRKSKRAA